MLSELIIKNHHKFNLFKTLTNDEINETKEFLDKNLNYSHHIYYDIFSLNINQENVYDVLWVCDFLQYNKYEQLKEYIQLQILDKKININKNKLKRTVMYDDIYENECLKSHECKCNYDRTNYIINLRHIICFKYLEIKNIKCDSKYNLFDEICITGNILLIAYLHKVGYKGTNRAIFNASMGDHKWLIKYLKEIGYCEQNKSKEVILK